MALYRSFTTSADVSSLLCAQVAEKCLSLGAQKALYVAADMASDTEPDRVVDFAVEKLGGLDFVILNHIGPSPFTMWGGDVEHTKWLMKVAQLLMSSICFKGNDGKMYLVFFLQRSISSAIFRWPGGLCPHWSKAKAHWWWFHHFSVSRHHFQPVTEMKLLGKVAS